MDQSIIDAIDAELARRKQGTDTGGVDLAAIDAELERRRASQKKTEQKGRFGDALKPIFGGHNPIAETVDMISPTLDTSSKRPLSTRAIDTAAFALNMPVRIATQGKYGIDDAIKYATGGAYGAERLAEGERGFVENNPAIVNAMGAIGEIAPGVGGTMGQGFRPPMALNPSPSNARIPPQVIPNAQSGRLAQQRAMDAVRDMRAFEESQVPVVPLSFAQAPTRGLGKQISETPLIGAPLHNNMESAYRGLSEARNRLAEDISPAATYEQAGAIVQRGLDRFRTQSLDDLEPGVSQALNINPVSPAQPRQIMSQAAQARATQAAPIINQSGGGTALTSRGINVPAALPRNQTLTVRTGIEALDDAELGRVIRAPSNETSFATRQEALYESARRSLPPQMRENNTANPQLLAATNARRVFQGIADNEARSGIRSGMLTGRFGGMAERLRTNVTLDTLSAMRTEVGRALSNFGLYDANLDRTQLKQIYGALSDDIEAAYLDLRNRAYIGTRVGNNHPNHVPLSVARRADRALYEIRRANRYTRAGIDRMDSFVKVVGANSPEVAVKSIVDAAKTGGAGNMRLVRNALGVLRPEERAAVASVLVRQMGRPINSARGVSQEVGFSPQTFVTNYNALTPEARALLFGEEHARALENLFRVSRRVADVEALTNFSRSGTNALNVGGLATTIASIARGDIITPAVVGGGMYGVAHLLASPRWARWATQYMQLRAAAARSPARVNAALRNHINALRRGVRIDPELGAVLLLVNQDSGENNDG